MRTDWSLENIGSQHGKRVLITGANSGIGYFTALELARRGATVLLACRSEKRGLEALRKIESESPGALVELVLLDLASLSSIRTVGENLKAEGLPLHVLLNNAGVMAPPGRLETEDGFELQFGTNVLGHFLLTALLHPLLEQAENGRVVNVASIAHKRGRIDFEDLQCEKKYDPMTSYAQSKLGNLLFSFELQRRSSVRSVACHPGVAGTSLFRTGDYGRVEKVVRTLLTYLIGWFLNSSKQGALPNLFAATSELAEDGGYYGPQGFREMRGGDVGPARVKSQARDQDTAQRLWEVCEELTGVEFL